MFMLQRRRLANKKQESWLAKNAVSEEDQVAAEQPPAPEVTMGEDPMQGLEGLDVAGPRQV